MEHLQKTFHKYSNLDEKGLLCSVPVKAFQSKEFMDQFNVLNTYGL